MKARWSALVLGLATLQVLAAATEPGLKKPVSLAHLDLLTEVAATTEEGAPAALRIILKNVGKVTVDMPVLRRSCHPDNGVQIQSFWTAADGRSGGGAGGDVEQTINPH